jgi:hypothetical protein
MEKFALYIKDCIDQQKKDNPNSADEDLFDTVLEDIGSMVLDYTFWDYEMDSGVGED